MCVTLWSTTLTRSSNHLSLSAGAKDEPTVVMAAHCSRSEVQLEGDGGAAWGILMAQDSTPEHKASAAALLYKHSSNDAIGIAIKEAGRFDVLVLLLQDVSMEETKAHLHVAMALENFSQDGANAAAIIAAGALEPLVEWMQSGNIMKQSRAVHLVWQLSKHEY